MGGEPRGKFGIGDRKGTDGWGKSLWVKKRRLSREVGWGWNASMKKERNGDERGRETRTKRKGKKGGPLFRGRESRKIGRGGEVKFFFEKFILLIYYIR